MPLECTYKIEGDVQQESLEHSQPMETSSVTLPGTINSSLSPLRPQSLLKGAGVNRKKKSTKKPKGKSTLRNKGKAKKAGSKKKQVKPKKKNTSGQKKKSSSTPKKSKSAKAKKPAKKPGKK